MRHWIEAHSRSAGRSSGAPRFARQRHPASATHWTWPVFWRLITPILACAGLVQGESNASVWTARWDPYSQNYFGFPPCQIEEATNSIRVLTRFEQDMHLGDADVDLYNGRENDLLLSFSDDGQLEWYRRLFSAAAPYVDEAVSGFHVLDGISYLVLPASRDPWCYEDAQDSFEALHLMDPSTELLGPGVIAYGPGGSVLFAESYRQRIGSSWNKRFILTPDEPSEQIRIVNMGPFRIDVDAEPDSSESFHLNGIQEGGETLYHNDEIVLDCRYIPPPDSAPSWDEWITVRLQGEDGSNRTISFSGMPNRLGVDTEVLREGLDFGALRTGQPGRLEVTLRSSYEDTFLVRISTVPGDHFKLIGPDTLRVLGMETATFEVEATSEDVGFASGIVTIIGPGGEDYEIDCRAVFFAHTPGDPRDIKTRTKPAVKPRLRPGPAGPTRSRAGALANANHETATDGRNLYLELEATERSDYTGKETVYLDLDGMILVLDTRGHVVRSLPQGAGRLPLGYVRPDRDGFIIDESTGIHHVSPEGDVTWSVPTSPGLTFTYDEDFGEHRTAVISAAFSGSVSVGDQTLVTPHAVVEITPDGNVARFEPISFRGMEDEFYLPKIWASRKADGTTALYHQSSDWTGQEPSTLWETPLLAGGGHGNPLRLIEGGVPSDLQFGSGMTWVAWTPIWNCDEAITIYDGDVPTPLSEVCAGVSGFGPGSALGTVTVQLRIPDPPAGSRHRPEDLPVTHMQLWGCDSASDDDDCGPDGWLYPAVAVNGGNRVTFDESTLGELVSFVDVRELYLWSDEKLLGRIGLHYPRELYESRISKEVLVTLHTELIPYASHPLERGSAWRYPRDYMYRSDKPDSPLGVPITAPAALVPTTMLIPPPDVHGNFRFQNVDPEKVPVLFVHGVYGVDGGYWGTSGSGYDENSYPARLRSLSNDNYQCWEYYYPPDQPLADSGFLLGADLPEVRSRYLGDDEHALRIVAHSMGTIVVRGCLEGVARAYDSAGNVVSSPNPAGVGKVALLCGPYNGSFGGNRAYYGLMLPSKSYTLAGFDPSAPAVRDMAIGSRLMMDLNAAGPQIPDGIEYLSINGTTWMGTMRSAPLINARLAIESQNHDDGIVSGSSSSLLPHRVPSYYLDGLSHRDLRSPDNPTRVLPNTPPDDKTACVPAILYAFFEGQTLTEASCGAGVAHFVTDTGPGWNGGDGAWNGRRSDADASSAFEFRHDVGLPVVTIFAKDDGQGHEWLPRRRSTGEGLRFRMHSSFEGDGCTVHLSPERTSRCWIPFCDSYGDRGMFLYYAQNNNESGYKANLPEALRTPAFVGFEVKGDDEVRINSELDPRSGRLPVEGSGWHIPTNALGGPEDGDVRFPVVVHVPGGHAAFTAVGEIVLRWCSTTYSRLGLPRALLSALDGNDAPAVTVEGSTGSVRVDSGVGETSFTFGGVDPLSDIKIVDPRGQTHRLRGSDSPGFHRALDAEQESGILTVVDPAPGVWRFERVSTGAGRGLGDLQAGCLRTVANELRLALDSLGTSKGLVLRASMGVDASRFDSLTVSGGWRSETGAAGTLSFRDDGIAPDSTAGDGVFVAVLSGDGLGLVDLDASFSGKLDDEPFSRRSSGQYDFGRYEWTPVLPGVESVHVSPGRVVLRWTSPVDLMIADARVERRMIEPEKTDWVDLGPGSVRLDPGSMAWTTEDRDVHPGDEFDYRLTLTATIGDDVATEPIRVRIPHVMTTGQPRLDPPAPNPTSGDVILTYDSGGGSAEAIEIFDVSGRLLRAWTRRADHLEASGRLRWDGNDRWGRKVPSGIYTVRLHTNSGRTTAAIALMR